MGVNGSLKSNPEISFRAEEEILLLLLLLLENTHSKARSAFLKKRKMILQEEMTGKIPLKKKMLPRRSDIF